MRSLISLKRSDTYILIDYDEASLVGLIKVTKTNYCENEILFISSLFYT